MGGKAKPKASTSSWTLVRLAILAAFIGAIAQACHTILAEYGEWLGPLVNSTVFLTITGAALFTHKEEATQLFSEALSKNGWWLLVPTGLVAFLGAGTRLVTVTCGAKGRIVLLDTQKSARECSQGERIRFYRPTFVPYPTPVIRLADGVEGGPEAERKVFPFSSNEIHYPADFSPPLSLLVVLDRNGFEALIGSEDDEAPAPGACAAKKAMYCLALAVKGKPPLPLLPLGRNGIIVGASAPSIDQLKRRREIAPPSPHEPLAVEDFAVSPEVPLTAELRVLKGGQYEPCTSPPRVTPGRTKENVWIVEATRLCPQ